MPYSKIVRYDADAPNAEFSKYLGGTMGYNGLPTMRAKTKLAMERANGVMVWTVNDDTLDKFVVECDSGDGAREIVYLIRVT